MGLLSPECSNSPEATTHGPQRSLTPLPDQPPSSPAHSDAQPSTNTNYFGLPISRGLSPPLDPPSLEDSLPLTGPWALLKAMQADPLAVDSQIVDLLMNEA
ncbi:hypothetical protein C0989_007145 [Termitomyces sp. Mn162]|nr:hypothetical protein C0989_007145 [Termitomyces sp. Mn162]